MDYEKAAWRAVRPVLPHVKLQGCFFHYSQAVWRRVQRLGRTSSTLYLFIVRFSLIKIVLLQHAYFMVLCHCLMKTLQLSLCDLYI